MDGTQNSLNRRRKLDWLEESHEEAGECRILSNAQCPSEGVDVPALDAVVFLNPKESIVDIIQAVGRVMRKAEGKQYGYVILPVAIPAGADAASILDNQDSYRTVWNVLKALRAHDSKRFEQSIIDGNILSENIIWYRPETCVDCLAGVCDRHKPRPSCEMCEAEFAGSGEPCPKHAPPTGVDIPAHLIQSKIVEKVSDRRYLEEWAKDVAHIVGNTTARINDLYNSNKSIKKELDEFHTGLQKIINDSIKREDSVDMLAQHMVMGRVFDALFADGAGEETSGNRFTGHNPVSRSMDTVLASIRKHGLEAEMEKLEKFYEEVEGRVSAITTHGGRQSVIHELYDKFFNHAFKKEAERLGIVYTPIELVDFVLKSSDHLMRENFGKGLTSRAVNIIDPFTGTGSFLTRMMSRELGLISDRDLQHKYKNNMFASEIVLMAYYIAAVNCEATFMERTGKYIPFEGITLTDTFHAKNLDEQWDEGMFSDTQKRIERQRKSKITVVVGNPPYSAGQGNYSDQNQNAAYPEIDGRIKNTYMKKAISKGKGYSFYDSYIRALRWASDRVGKSGIIGFVTNGSFITSDAGAGVRACLQQEFTDVWVFDLRGNQRTQGEISKKEGGKIFGSGSRAPVAITILVKNPKKAAPGTIHYRDIGDYHDREKKLEIIRTAGSIKGTDWKVITPDKHHDWIEQRNSEFSKYLPLGSKSAKAGKGNAIFNTYSLGVGTNRDVWAYNRSISTLQKNMNTHIQYCNTQNLDTPIHDLTLAKWTPTLSKLLKQNGHQVFDQNKIRIALYRPFFKQFLYFDKVFNHMQALIPK